MITVKLGIEENETDEEIRKVARKSLNGEYAIEICRAVVRTK